MWWYEEGATPRLVDLVWRREEACEGEPPVVELLKIQNASWSLRGQSHFLTYEEPDSAGSGDSGALRTRTTLRVEPEQLTLIRHGAVRWNHTFRAGQTQTSTMHLGAMAMRLQTITRTFTVDVLPLGGVVTLAYELSLADEPQEVKLEFRFGSCAEK